MAKKRHTTQGVIEKIRMVARATGRPHQGDCLAHVVRADFDALAIQRARIMQPLKALFVLSFVTDRPMVAGAGTAADSAILLAGASNAMANIRGYKLVNDEIGTNHRVVARETWRHLAPH
jgi:iron complex transport system substrate-binding protein